MRRELARLFWRMIPATQAAALLGINRKTALRYYARLRRHIARGSEGRRRQSLRDLTEQAAGLPAVALRLGRSSVGRLPVVSVVRWGRQVSIVLPTELPSAQAARLAPLPPQAADWEAARPEAGDDPVLAQFAAFAERCAATYRGGWRRNFRLFAREMEFRFNHRNDPDVVDALARVLETGPV